MNKTLIVLKNEIVTLLARPSFWLAALGLPLVGAAVFAVVGWINRDADVSQAVNEVVAGPQSTLPEGYVDLSGIIREVPESVPPGAFIAYPDEAAARLALESGEITAFYIVAEDYVETGAITYVRPDFNPLSSSSDQSGMFNWMVEVNLAGGDMLFASLINGPLDEQETSLATTAPQFEQDSPLSFFVPYAVALVFYMLIISSASLLLGNISKEKENRVMEMLLTSVTPRQLLTGKILGLGIVGLGQTVLWLGTSYVLLNLSGRDLSTVRGHLLAGFVPGLGTGLFHPRLRRLRQPDGGAGRAGAQPARGLAGHLRSHAPAHDPALLLQHRLCPGTQRDDRHRVEHLPAHRPGGDDGAPFLRRRGLVAAVAGRAPAGRDGSAHRPRGSRDVPRPVAAGGAGVQREGVLQGAGGEDVSNWRAGGGSPL
ncbi:MAG: ABC-2 type transport system permease protein [Anaerolineaceae bacterium]|nr:MAG: ABC-2 type transport system permease protein [Anaerolineaceae bacterium]